MKKILTVILSLAMLLSLAACNKTDNTQDNVDNSTDVVDVTGEESSVNAGTVVVGPPDNFDPYTDIEETSELTDETLQARKRLKAIINSCRTDDEIINYPVEMNNHNFALNNLGLTAGAIVDYSVAQSDDLSYIIGIFRVADDAMEDTLNILNSLTSESVPSKMFEIEEYLVFIKCSNAEELETKIKAAFADTELDIDRWSTYYPVENSVVNEIEPGDKTEELELVGTDLVPVEDTREPVSGENTTNTENINESTQEQGDAE